MIGQNNKIILFPATMSEQEVCVLSNLSSLSVAAMITNWLSGTSGIYQSEHFVIMMILSSDSQYESIDYDFTPDLVTS